MRLAHAAQHLHTGCALYSRGAFQPFALQPQFLQDAFLAPFSQFTTALDRTCEGRSLNTAKGFTSVAAAVDAWKDNFSALPTAVPRIVGRPPAAPSIDVAPSARFRAIATDRSNGNTLFLNLSSVIRDGQSATGQSLALLGPNAQRFSGEYAAVVALRNVQYDCAARTMTVTAQADWDRDERFAGEHLPHLLRAVQKKPQSSRPRSIPLAAPFLRRRGRTIHQFKRRGTPFAIAGRHHGWRAGYPVSGTTPRPTARTRMSRIGPARPTRNFSDRRRPKSNRCRSPAGYPREYADLAFVKLRYYATERAALSRLADRDLDDAKILAAWRGQGWTERLKLIQDFHSFTTSDIEYGLAFRDRFATTLGLRSSDADGRKWLGEYIRSQAWIEGS